MSDIPLTLGEVLIIATIIASTAGAVWRIGMVFGRFETRIVALEKDKFPMSVASEAALRMAILNPGMPVPDPRDPTKVIVVDRARMGATA